MIIGVACVEVGGSSGGEARSDTCMVVSSLALAPSRDSVRSEFARGRSRIVKVCRIGGVAASLMIVNQHFWLQYHNQSELLRPCSSSDTHLIRPSDTSEAYALHHKLLPFHQYINLTHQNTYIHGPFDFATVHGCKSRDRMDQVDWGILCSHTAMFHNSAISRDASSHMHNISKSEYRQLYP